VRSTIGDRVMSRHAEEEPAVHEGGRWTADAGVGFVETLGIPSGHRGAARRSGSSSSSLLFHPAWSAAAS
jgi:hypothetical protein